jgi:hypothetical protein
MEGGDLLFILANNLSRACRGAGLSSPRGEGAFSWD